MQILLSQLQQFTNFTFNYIFTVHKDCLSYFLRFPGISLDFLDFFPSLKIPFWGHNFLETGNFLESGNAV